MVERLEQHACFGGRQEVWKHISTTLGCSMRFAVYLPPQAASEKCPVLYWLSGLSCTEQNFITKAGAQRSAAELGIILIAPDTSPRGDEVPDDPGYDLGQGAGFYLNATEQPWAKNFQMHDYVTRELPDLIEGFFPANAKRAVSGHSMGGHGALVCALKNPGRYQSISAFAPIVCPSQVPWGEKAFTAYLGPDRNAWKEWDACELIRSSREHLPLRIDQGQADEFLKRELMPERLISVCNEIGYPLEFHFRSEADHSYYFVASYIGEHIGHHAKYLV